MLTRAELEEFDPEPREVAGYARYLCPLGDCRTKPADAAHKSLSVKDNFWQCFRCGQKGKFDVVDGGGVAQSRPRVMDKSRAWAKDLM